MTNNSNNNSNNYSNNYSNHSNKNSNNGVLFYIVLFMYLLFTFLPMSQRRSANSEQRTSCLSDRIIAIRIYIYKQHNYYYYY